MRRREFAGLVGGAVVAWPFLARAQQPERIRRVGVLMAVPQRENDAQARVAALEHELKRLGWIIGQNLQIEYRWGIFEIDQERAAGADLLKWAPDVILI